MLPITFHKLISSFCEFIATEGTFVQLIKRYYAAHFLESPISNFFAILNMHSTMTNYQTYYCDFLHQIHITLLNIHILLILIYNIHRPVFRMRC